MISSFLSRCAKIRCSPAMAGEAYPLPFLNSQTNGGGNSRRRFVSADMPLWVGPKNDVQSCVTASGDSDLGFPDILVCPETRLDKRSRAAKERNAVRLEWWGISDEILALDAHAFFDIY